MGRASGVGSANRVGAHRSAGVRRRHPIHDINTLVREFGEHFSGQAPTRTGEKGLCYANALRFARTHPRVRYFEGFASPNSAGDSITYGHAWCVDKHGHVLDPTWCAPAATYHGIEIPLARLGWDAIGELARYSTSGGMLYNYGYGDPLLSYPWPLSDESISQLRALLDNIS